MVVVNDDLFLTDKFDSLGNKNEFSLNMGLYLLQSKIKSFIKKNPGKKPYVMIKVYEYVDKRFEDLVQANNKKMLDHHQARLDKLIKVMDGKQITITSDPVVVKQRASQMDIIKLPAKTKEKIIGCDGTSVEKVRSNTHEPPKYKFERPSKTSEAFIPETYNVFCTLDIKEKPTHIRDDFKVKRRLFDKDYIVTVERTFDPEFGTDDGEDLISLTKKAEIVSKSLNSMSEIDFESIIQQYKMLNNKLFELSNSSIDTIKEQSELIMKKNYEIMKLKKTMREAIDRIDNITGEDSFNINEPRSYKRSGSSDEEPWDYNFKDSGDDNESVDGDDDFDSD